MALDAKTDYEIQYWKVAGMKEVDNAYYMRYLKKFAVTPENFRGLKILDAGSGPKGGLTMIMFEDTACVAVDPLFDIYREHDILRIRPGVRTVTCHAEEMMDNSIADIDALFSCNALDHNTTAGVDKVSLAIENFKEVLKPGGKVYLWVHLREQDELNLGHDFQVNEEAVVIAFKSNGFKEIACRVEPFDKYAALFLTAVK